MELVVKLRSPKIKVTLRNYFIIQDVCKWLVRNTFLFVSLALMGIIFLLSNQIAAESAQLSGAAQELCNHIFILREITKIFPIRKIAHFVLYALLGTSLFTHIRWNYDLEIPLYYIFTLLITFVYACSDEIHQMFVDGRGALLTDVLIDSLGCILALVLNYIILKILITKESR